METINLEGRRIQLARVEGTPDVFNSPNFVLVKARWVGDEETNTCVMCNNKFNQLRRKHHCRQCGKILCSKCCKEKIPLPQLGVEEPERVCEICRPVTELVTKSRSPMQNFKIDAAQGIVKLCSSIENLQKVAELGGIQTLIALSKAENQAITGHVASALQILSMHQPLHKYLAHTGAIKALCHIINQTPETSDFILTDAISALMIYCKSQELKTKALEDGVLEPVLKLCTVGESNTVSLMAVSTLSHIVEHPGTHDKVVESRSNILTRLCALTGDSDEQMQEVALKCLAHIATGSNWQKHRIVQEDFTTGRGIRTALDSKPKNESILCNAACLTANLAVSDEDQGGLQELLDRLCDILRSDTQNSDLIVNVVRGIANFSKFQQNSSKLMSVLPVIVFKCIKSSKPYIKLHGMRAIMHLLSHRPNDTAKELVRDGAGELLESMSRLPSLMTTMHSALLDQAPCIVRPM